MRKYVSAQRQQAFAALDRWQKTEQLLDVLLVGGGINGAVSALALARQGYQVALIEADDFAGRTSQASSNLIWGGIKYLENFEFGLVRKLSAARNNLLRAYPSLVRELRFLMPHQRNDKHSLLKLYAGAWFYWLWGGFQTRVPSFYTRTGLQQTGFPLNLTHLNGGFEYSDAFLIENDARFVFNLINQAAAAGAFVFNYTQLKAIKSVPPTASRKAPAAPYPYWQAQALDKVTNKRLTIKAKVFINAAGPAVDAINQKNKLVTRHHHLFSKGVHLLVKRLLPDARALAFYANDGRLFFALPMGVEGGVEGGDDGKSGKTCIGTTDIFVKTPETRVNKAERTFILANINALLNLRQPLTEKDIIAERCGVRPLVQPVTQAQQQQAAANDADWFSLSRKHIIETNDERRQINIFGGKLTECLNVGAEVYHATRKWLAPYHADRTMAATNQAENRDTGKPSFVFLRKFLVSGRRFKWFGESSASQRKAFLTRASKQLRTQQASVLWRRYDKGAFIILERLEEVYERAYGGKSSVNHQQKWQRELQRLCAPLVPASNVLMIELEYSLAHEWVVQGEDFLRRRTMLALTEPLAVLRKSPAWKKLRRIS